MRLGVASSEVAGYNLAVRETGECFFELVKKSITSVDRTKEDTPRADRAGNAACHMGLSFRGCGVKPAGNAAWLNCYLRFRL